MKLLAASEFSLEDLTAAYNQTRTDYLIPMPMNPNRLHEYMVLYDVDLQRSCVAVEDRAIVGLGMLGLRPHEGWITRLGVLPEGRRRGVGSAMMDRLIGYSLAENATTMWLEVIKGNDPAHSLFLKYNFQPTRELIVARRPPRTMRSVSSILAARKINYLQHEEVIDLHCSRTERMNWLNAVATMNNVRRITAKTLDDDEQDPVHEVPHLSGIRVEFQNGTEGWVSYQATTLQLKRISVEVLHGDSTQVTADLLGIMHRLHGTQDAIVENIPDDDEWQGFIKAGYFEVFRRIEMALDLTSFDR
jgi:ribosomal protein S18 acetylase RimI-like enzyme